MFTVEYGIDNMDRGNHDYETIGTGKRIAVDPGVSDFQRGDVIYFTTPEYSNGNSRFKSSQNIIFQELLAYQERKLKLKKVRYSLMIKN